MTCENYRRDLAEAAGEGWQGTRRSAAAQSHASQCTACGTYAAGQARLRRAAALLAAEAEREGPPPELEALLAAEFRRVMAARKPPLARRHLAGWLAAACVAASLLLAWAVNAPRSSSASANRAALPPLARRRMPASADALAGGSAPTSVAGPRPTLKRPVHFAGRRSLRPAAEQPGAAAEQPFVPIPYTAPLDARERAEVVRVDLPVSALIAAGFSIRVTEPDARAQADLMVGEDGRARAVRLISISENTGAFQ